MLVPEGREEVTTEGGLDVAGQEARLKSVIAKLAGAGIVTSVFIDAELRPHLDQWEFLSTVQRISTEAAEEIITEAQCTGDLIGVRISIADEEDGQDPWTLPPSRRRIERPIEGPLPATVAIVRANLLYVEKQGLPPAMCCSEPTICSRSGT